MSEHFIARYAPDPRRVSSVFMITDDQLFKSILEGVKAGIDMSNHEPSAAKASAAALGIMREKGMIPDNIFSDRS